MVLLCVVTIVRGYEVFRGDDGKAISLTPCVFGYFFNVITMASKINHMMPVSAQA
jgi:hypothetical protein